MPVDVDETAIASNVRVLRERTGVAVCGVVKADGYGHGAIVAARAMLAGGATWLGVADIAEGIALRNAGIDAPVLAWLHSAEPDMAAAVANGIDIGVNSASQLAAAAAVAREGRRVRVHLKVDSGLGRNGVPVAEWADVVERAAQLQDAGLIDVHGVFSHVAGASAAADLDQLAVFNTALEAAETLEAPLRHFAASSAALSLPAGRFDMVRVGIAAYGLHPDGPLDGTGGDAAEMGLRPAMRVNGTAESGVIPIGLVHGLLPVTGVPVLVDDRFVTVQSVGRASTVLSEPVSGHAVLFGDPARGEPSADAWALAADTIGYEVVTRMRAGWSS